MDPNDPFAFPGQPPGENEAPPNPLPPNPYSTLGHTNRSHLFSGPQSHARNFAPAPHLTPIMDPNDPFSFGGRLVGNDQAPAYPQLPNPYQHQVNANPSQRYSSPRPPARNIGTPNPLLPNPYQHQGHATPSQFYSSPRPPGRIVGTPIELPPILYPNHTQASPLGFSNAPQTQADTAASSRLPPLNQHLSQIDTVPGGFYYDPQLLDENAGPPYPGSPNAYTGAVLEDQNDWRIGTDEGPPIALDDDIWNFYGEAHQDAHANAHPATVTAAPPELALGFGEPYNASVQVDAEHQNAFADAQFAPPAAPPRELAPGFGEPYNPSVHVTINKLTQTQVDISEGPSNAALVAQMQNPNHEPEQTAEPVHNGAHTADGLRGRLILYEDDPNGKCDYSTREGNLCGRKAPKLRSHGSGERLCRCTKHMESWRRSHALVPSFRLIKKSFPEAKEEIYPRHEPLDQEVLHADDSLRTEKGQQDKWQERFLRAAMTPYNGDNKKYGDHQRVFNGNVECDADGRYDDHMVNARVAMLYYIAWNTQVGGERIYAIHGDNGGYPKETRRLTFLQRLEMMEEQLKIDKKIAMDVIEGRGVTAFVENPDAFFRRKATNNTNNEFKKRPRPDDGDNESQADGVDAVETPTPQPRRKRAVRKTAPKPKTEGKGKEKVQDIPGTQVYKLQDLSDPNDEKGDVQPPPAGAPPALRSSEPMNADPGCSKSLEPDLKLAPSEEEQSDLFNGENSGSMSPESWEKLLGDIDVLARNGELGPNVGREEGV